MPSDSSAVDAAVVALLAGDSPLMDLQTDGVHMDVGPSGLTAFVVVSMIDHEDEYMFGGCAYERFTYLAKAVTRDTSGANTKLAAARLHALLQDGALTISGYVHMLTRRIGRVRYTEVDDANKDTRWQHRGGHYDVLVSPA